jgi:hypothetical protein
MEEQWEIENLSFEGNLKDDKVICRNCGWSWNLKDGGNDPFVCHSCESDNSRFYTGNETYSNFKVDPNLIVQGVGSLASLGGNIAQSKSSKQMSKSELQKEIDTRCGKDKSKALLKKKRNEYLQCKQNVIAKIDSDKKMAQDDAKKQLEATQQKTQQEALQRRQSEKRNTYLIVGVVVALVIGFVVYKKMNK